MSKRELLQMALDALEYVEPMYNDVDVVTDALEAFRAELAKPEPEPVGWYDSIYKDFSRVDRIGWIPLYRKEDV